MLEEILQTDSLGNRQQIEYILDVVESGTASVPALMEACYARSYGYRRSFRSLVKLLVATGHLVIEDERISLGKVSPADRGNRFVEFFCTRLFSAMTKAGHLHHLFNGETLSFDSDGELIHFRNNRVPLSYAPLRNLLIELGLMIRDPYLHNVYVVAEAHYSWFREGLADWVGDSSIAGRLTLEELKKRLQSQEKAGRIAEEFVVGFEKRRLEGHPRIDRVRMISNLDVGAGYDIQSFVDVGSVIIDRYIEVKSYSGNPSFYWSTQEVAMAKVKGDSYFLCLVDREQMDTPGYIPTFVRGPGDRMFSTKEWFHSCENYYFEKK